MTSLHDLSKKQLIELLDLAFAVGSKESEVIQYLITQIQQRPQHPRITIDLPINGVSRDYADFRIRLDQVKYENACNSSNSNKLYEVMKESLEYDLNIYSI
ncbi:MAG: hypothetical protein WBF90_32195 [Rivularia sp. (in: cyanobacteria)]